MPGYLTYDSGTYHIMVKTLAETGGFLIDNGYEAAPSEELIVGQLRAPDGRLVAQYPETFTIWRYRSTWSSAGMASSCWRPWRG